LCSCCAPASACAGAVCALLLKHGGKWHHGKPWLDTDPHAPVALAAVQLKAAAKADARAPMPQAEVLTAIVLTSSSWGMPSGCVAAQCS
jgi:multisubunit Na+/H+ antiporter MnhC subunit